MKKVLIVDDDRDIREILLMILDGEGYEVSGLENGSDVRAKVDAFKPDLVLLDVQLGDADGRDICSDLKHDPLTEKLPVIIISASHGSRTLGEKSCQADDYIDKPFDISNLVSQVKRLAA